MPNHRDEPTTIVSFTLPTADVRIGVPGSAPAPDRLAGTPYRLVAPLGEGGMGAAVEAEHVRTGARVVLKMLHHRYAGHPALADRLRIEGEILASLDHPNLVRVYGLGHAPYGGRYIVMERLFGRTLRDEVRERRALPPLEAIGYVRQALLGMALVHRAGIVHRDLKLDNLFLCDAVEAERHSSILAQKPNNDDDRGKGALGAARADRGARVVKVLDFGIAKLLDAGAHAVAGAQSNGRHSFCLPVARLQFPTEEGVCIGTPRFASPEQATGKGVDARADLYALGVVLYTLLTGRGLFEELTAPTAILEAHLCRKPPPPSQRAPRFVPKALDAVVLRALAKNPADRFSSAEAFTEALDDVALSWDETTDASAPAVRVFAMSEALASPVDSRTRFEATIELTSLDVLDGEPAATPVAVGGGPAFDGDVSEGNFLADLVVFRRGPLSTTAVAVGAFVSGGLIALAIAQLLT